MAIGTRIQGYRNSAPRSVKLMGAGDGARALVARYMLGGGPNVFGDEGEARGRVRLDTPVAGVAPNAVIVVHLDGEPVTAPLPPVRTASMLSLVVLEPGAGGAGMPAPEIRALQSVADLYVTTSDPDFVSELVSNLVS